MDKIDGDSNSQIYEFATACHRIYQMVFEVNSDSKIWKFNICIFVSHNSFNTDSRMHRRSNFGFTFICLTNRCARKDVLRYFFSSRVNPGGAEKHGLVVHLLKTAFNQQLRKFSRGIKTGGGLP